MPSVRDQYARKIIEEHQLPQEHSPGGIPSLPAAPIETAQLWTRDGGFGRDTPFSIGIVGAGAAGLYIGMTLEKINKVMKGRGLHPIEYEILEAEKKDGGHPVGGRLWTHRFSDSKNDYYDRGAMRFPDHPPMRPVMKLFKDLGLEDKKIPYVMTIPENRYLFNSKIHTDLNLQILAQSGQYDPFETRVPGLTGTVKDMVNKQIGGIRALLAKDFDKGWDELMKYDMWSTRAYFTLKGTPEPGVGTYSGPVVDYLETFGTGTNMYDLALSETVLESLDFDYPGNFDWWTIQGGSSEIAKKMAERIPSSRIFNDRRVTALAPSIGFRVPSDRSDDPQSYLPKLLGVDVTTSGRSQAPEIRSYTHVVSTVPFGALRMIDTSDCHFSWELQSAIRSLGYEGSTKVGIKFTERWWETKFAQRGGVSYTDRPTRVIVYPSYGIGGHDATILVSYTWAQDGIRLGSFAGDEHSEQILLDLILKDLTDIHGIDDYDYLPSLKVAHDIWSWYDNENSVGAFAFFGPGQFSRLYKEVTKPAVEGHLHFAGEATSPWHAWVLGALNSAHRVLREIFVQESAAGTFGEHGQAILDVIDAEYDFTELPNELLTKQVALACDKKLDLAEIARAPRYAQARAAFEKVL